MTKPLIFTISAEWDDEAAVWTGHCDDIPAAADAAALDGLLAKIRQWRSIHCRTTIRASIPSIDVEPTHAAIGIVPEFCVMQVLEAVGGIVEGELRAREQVVAAPLKARERPIEFCLKRDKSARNKDVG
jgi:Domain of unknown function (DUF1902)